MPLPVVPAAVVLVLGAWPARGLHALDRSAQPWWEKTAGTTFPQADGQRWWHAGANFSSQAAPLFDSAKVLYAQPNEPPFVGLSKSWEGKLGSGVPSFVTSHITFDKALQPFTYMFPAEDPGQQQVYDQGVLQGYASYHFVRHMKTCCGSGRGHFLDVGSKYGWYSLLAASLGCHVDAFESVPWSNALLQYSVAQLNRRLRSMVSLHRPSLLSNESGHDEVLVVPLEEGATQCDKGALCFSAKTSTIDDEVEFPEADTYRSCGMRVDGQGSEAEIFQGGRRFIDKMLPEVLAIDLSPSKQPVHKPGSDPSIHMLDLLTKQYNYTAHLLHWDTVKSYNWNVMSGKISSKKFTAPSPQLVKDCGANCMVYLTSPEVITHA